MPSDESEKLVYHYTSAEGLKGIIESSSFHCTNSLFLNDSQESIFVINLVKKYINNYFKDETNTCVRASLGRILDFIDFVSPQIKETSSPYIFSLSDEGDLLSQWRGYCKNGGYSLGFSKSFLGNNAKMYQAIQVKYISPEEAKDALSERLVTCCELIKKKLPTLDYDPMTLNDLSKILLTPGKSDEEIEQDKAALLKLITDLGLVVAGSIFNLMPEYKHSTFHEEKEFRLVQFARDPKNIEFRCKGGILAPFLKCLIDLMALREIVIAPSSHSEQCELGLKLFLKKHGLEHVAIKHSQIPYRS